MSTAVAWRYTCHMDTPVPLDGRIIGARIAQRRGDLRLEQTELAEQAGLSRAYVSRLESGAVQNPKVFDLARLAVVLGLSLPELVAPEADVIRTRYSHEWVELQKQLEGLPPEIAEQEMRAWRESVAVLHNASALARRN